MKKTEKKTENKHINRSKTTVGKCNGALLTVLFGTLRAYYFCKGVRIRIINKCGGQPQAPAIVLCNHGSFIDFMYAGTILRKSRPHFIVARLYFYHSLLGKVLRGLGCFPKSMFALDMESMKNCLRVLGNGEILAMMPEARLSTAGRFEDIQPSTYSFLKKCKVPIYTVMLQGDYLANPKWGNGVRRGAVIEAELDLLFTAEQVQTLSAEQIRQGVEQRLYYDEFQWLQTRPQVRYRNRHLAQGLDNILHTCPVCSGRYTIRAQGHQLSCTHCGPLTALDDRYQFDSGFCFAHLDQWYQWQSDLLREQILSDPGYRITSPVELRLPSDGKGLTRFAGRGICTLDREGLRYEGTRDGEQISQFFPISQIYRLLFGAGENFEIYNGTEIWYFVPDNKRSAVEWYMASMVLSDLHSAAQ